MRGFAASKLFSDYALADFDLATKLVAQLPEQDGEGRLFRCHEVVRALKSYLKGPWELEDGHYRTVEHSWLINREGHVLDLYSVGRYPMVQLIDTDIHFHRDLFRPGKLLKSLREDAIDQIRVRLAGV